MALAKYITKNLLAIRQALSKDSIEKFEETLLNQCIEIVYDDQCKSKEGKVILDILVRLISRLYPVIKFTELSDKYSDVTNELQRLALSINKDISVDHKAKATFSIIIGKTKYNGGCGRIYVGSDNWVVKISPNIPVESKNSDIPFAAGVSACLAAANVFRSVFGTIIGKENLDGDVNINLLTLRDGNDISPSLNIKDRDIGRWHLVGLGAIGHGILWAFSHLQNIVKAKIELIDDEEISLTNLQRYVCAIEEDEDKLKTEIAERVMGQGSITFQSHSIRWAEYVSRNQGENFDQVLVAVDSAKARIGIQSSLPRIILNGFTENGVSGITRHLGFGERACLACGFVPERKMRDYSQEVADNLGISHLENHVRHYIAYNFPVDDKLLVWISQANSIPKDQLDQYLGKPFSNFYSDQVCGGYLLSMSNSPAINSRMEAPLAFQSAIVGILLASEVCVLSSEIRPIDFPNSFHYYPLQQIKQSVNPYSTELLRDPTGRCLCHDNDFREVYERQWNS